MKKIVKKKKIAKKQLDGKKIVAQLEKLIGKDTHYFLTLETGDDKHIASGNINYDLLRWTVKSLENASHEHFIAQLIK